jgi:hypothetical protein
VSSRRNGTRIRTVLHTAEPVTELRYYATAADEQKAEMLVIEELIRAGRSVADIPSEELNVMVQEKVGEVLVLENEAAIDAIAYQDWLPQVLTAADAGLSATGVACEDFHIPLAGTSQQGITHVAEFDLDDLGGAPGTAVLGVASTMYQNANTMVLASSTVEWPEVTAADELAAPAPVTYLHAFDISDPASADSIAYIASGVVAGSIYGQFALDESDGDLRVVTTEEAWWGAQSVNHLFVLQDDGSGELKPVGDAGELAPGETVRSARFVGDTGYVVTFRQVDPLFVIDLADPTQPTVLGELKIPGFSEYMHPLDDDHLLTVGQEADESGRLTGNVALQIFGVADRTDPQLLHKHVFERTGTTEGSITHKAVTYYAEEGLLALPFLAYDYLEELAWSGLTSTLELFSVSISDGIEPQGAIDGNLLRSDAEQPGSGYYCNPWYFYGSEGNMLERGIFFDQYLYAVARTGIIVADIAAPAEPVAELRLGDPQAVPDYCSYQGVVEVVDGTGGAASEPSVVDSGGTDSGGTGGAVDVPDAGEGAAGGAGGASSAAMGGEGGAVSG